MGKIKSTRKYYFSVEGETEKWYLQWLQKTINNTECSKARVSFVIKIEKNPVSFVKGLSTIQKKTEITHVSDYESNEEVHRIQFQEMLGNLSRAKKTEKWDCLLLGI